MVLVRPPIEQYSGESTPGESPSRHSPGHPGRGVAWLLVIGLTAVALFVFSDPFPNDLAATDNSATTATIQRVIQQGNEAQVQAIASGDPAPMQATSTAEYYQQGVQTNQNLLSNGVIAIALVSLEWGSVSINGQTASATTWETWSTTYTDGTTEQSRDRNVYALVQSGDTWQIQVDTHPDAGQGPATAARPGRATPIPTPVTQPPSPSESASRNWAGYAATGGPFTGVAATWSVPSFSPGATAGVDATWVGIGGVRTTDLIQAGTQEMPSGTGTTEYEAWIEMLPRASQSVPLSVYPGDRISVSINQQSSTGWLISFANTTTGQNYQVVQQYVSSLSSAEWVEEAPTGARGRLLPLDDFGVISFGQATAMRNGQTLSIADAGGQSITMLGSRGVALAESSALGADGASFTVSRTTAPAFGPWQRIGP